MSTLVHSFNYTPLSGIFSLSRLPLFQLQCVQMSSHTINQCCSQSMVQEPLWEAFEALWGGSTRVFLLPTTHLYKARFLLFTSTMTTYYNRLDAEESGFLLSQRERCEKMKNNAALSTKFFCFEKLFFTKYILRNNGLTIKWVNTYF